MWVLTHAYSQRHASAHRHMHARKHNCETEKTDRDMKKSDGWTDRQTDNRRQTDRQTALATKILFNPKLEKAKHGWRQGTVVKFALLFHICNKVCGKTYHSQPNMYKKTYNWKGNHNLQNSSVDQTPGRLTPQTVSVCYSTIRRYGWYTKILQHPRRSRQGGRHFADHLMKWI